MKEKYRQEEEIGKHERLSLVSGRFCFSGRKKVGMLTGCGLETV